MPQPQPLHPGRRVGVEIELSGLTESAIAGTIMHVLGGRLHPAGTMRLEVRDSTLGTLHVELDTAYDTALAKGPDMLLSAARHVIPCEIITGPIAERDLPRLNALVKELRSAGAEGSRSGVAKGFGVHFNPEVTERDPAPILRVMQSYALLEPWLRSIEPMTLMRRILPFTDPWPPALRHRLIQMDADSCRLGALMDLYLKAAPSRNYGLDMLPLWVHMDQPRVKDALADATPSGRPTYHFRLPTSRIDEAQWRITDEWAKWQFVEHLAEDAARLNRLRRTWLETPAGWTGREAVWLERLEELLPVRNAA